MWPARSSWRTAPRARSWAPAAPSLPTRLYDHTFNFERGSVHYSDLDGPVDIFDHATRYRESYSLIGDHSRWDQYHASFHKSLAAYLDSIRQGEPPPVPGIAGLEELQFEAALRRSVAQERPVEVQQEFALGL